MQDCPGCPSCLTVQEQIAWACVQPSHSPESQKQNPLVVTALSFEAQEETAQAINDFRIALALEWILQAESLRPA